MTISAENWLVPERPLVCDTTVLLYLGRIEQIDLLPALFAPIYVPDSIVLELDMGRLLRSDTVDPRELSWARPVAVPQGLVAALPANRLGAGERAVIGYAHAHRGHAVGVDDLQARRLAERLGIMVVGTLGILLRAKRASLLRAVRPLIHALVTQGFRLDLDLYNDVLRLAGEEG